MKKKIFSEEVLLFSKEVYVHKQTTSTYIIYALLVTSSIIIFGALPFITVSLSKQSTGIIQSSIDRTPVFSPISGRVTSTRVVDNAPVTKGQLLISFDDQDIQAGMTKSQNRLEDVNRFINDLHLILEDKTLSMGRLKSKMYQTAFSGYLENRNLLKRRVEKLMVDWERNQSLFKEKIISRQEFEDMTFELQQAEDDLKVYEKQTKQQWSAELAQYKTEAEELQSILVQTQANRSNYLLRAPISGNVVITTPIQNGSFVFANQKLFEISPDSGLMALVYINPSDIGLIQTGQQVKFQVHAFNYNDWGLLHGHVKEISEDVVFTEDNRPVFKVKCKLDQDFLKLKNGYRGTLKKV